MKKLKIKWCLTPFICMSSTSGRVIPTQMTRHDSGKFDALFLIGALAIYVLLLSNFAFYISAYGDVKGYVYGAWPSWFNYQPLYPLLAGLIRRTTAVESIFFVQATMYAATLYLAFRLGQQCMRFGGYVMVIFGLFNMRAYFYVANPLTEILNLLLFFIVAYLVCILMADVGVGRKKWLVSICFGIALLLLALTRGPNSLMLLLFGTALLFLRKDSLPLRLLLVSILISTFLIALVYSLFAHATKSNVGLNLHTFIERTCARETCVASIFQQPDTPVVSAHWTQNATISGIRGAFEKKGYGPFSREYSDEMRSVYVRLFIHAPNSFLSQVVQNWKDQLMDHTIAIYPEDTNLRLLENDAYRLWAAGSTWASIFLAALAPILVAIGSVRILAGKASIVESLFTTWIASCLFASLILFAASWVSDSSRIRFHFEFQAVFLLLLFVSSITRFGVGRAESGIG